ncbi:MAG TPA: pyridoxal-phosphate dependent enzyme [Bryobacteraceae bacterium]|jgi:diaminopropionate ammonia-lyase|nr:pyridoxal-phosphate dependent enzyme [Bryobacteraceae bacterium]
MRFVRNPFRQPALFPAPSNSAREFHRTLDGYAPTPLVDCQPLADSLALRSLHVKDESHRFGLNSFKALGASFAMQRLARPGTIFSAATAGNHGRAVAWSARRLGCSAKIFVPSITIPARIENIRREGADVRIVDGSYEDAVRLGDAESRERGWQVISDTGYEGYLEIPEWVVEGYQTLFLESDCTPDAVFIQSGVGGLLSAAVDHFRSREPSPTIVCVEPEVADGLLESISSPSGEPCSSKGPQNSIMAGLNCREVSLTAWPSIKRGVDIFVAIEDFRTLDAMRLLSAAGIDSGESGAAGLAGLVALRDQFQGQRVLVINTEGHCT